MAQIVKDLADDEVKRGTKLSPVIRPDFEAIYYEIQVVLQITLIPRGTSHTWDPNEFKVVDI